MNKKVTSLVDSYGHKFVPCNTPTFDHKTFLENNSQTIVVSTADELHDLLKIDGYTNVQNDVALLLNSRRLDFEDPKAVADIIRKRFAERSVKSPFEGMTDEEIFVNIKSRHVQSLAELDNYAEYIAGALSVTLPSEKLLESSTDSEASSE